MIRPRRPLPLAIVALLLLAGLGSLVALNPSGLLFAHDTDEPHEHGDHDHSDHGDHGSDLVPEAPSPEEMQRMMEEWMASIEPGDAHEWLAQFEGEWRTEMAPMGGADAEPEEGGMWAEMTLGGRFIEMHYDSTMQLPTGPYDYKGAGTIGYDNNRKLFQSTWRDNLSTSILVARGSINQEASAVTMYGEMDEPMLGVVGRMVRYEYQWIDDNTFVLRLYDLHAGEDYVAMEITHHRVDPEPHHDHSHDNDHGDHDHDHEDDHGDHDHDHDHDEMD